MSEEYKNRVIVLQDLEHIPIELNRILHSSLPGLNRQSMLRSRLRPVSMDARVKPAHDEGKSAST